MVGGAIAAPLTRKDFRGSFNALTAILVTSSATKAIKAFWHERRPNGENNNSFPSQHAAECFAAAVVLDHRFKDVIGPTAFGIATAVSLTRIFAHKHYPADVIAGAAIGVIAAEWADELPA